MRMEGELTLHPNPHPPKCRCVAVSRTESGWVGKLSVDCRNESRKCRNQPAVRSARQSASSLLRGRGLREARPIPRPEIRARNHVWGRVHMRVPWKGTCRCMWPHSLANLRCRIVTWTMSGTLFRSACALASPHRRDHSLCVHATCSPAGSVCPVMTNGQWTGSRRAWKTLSPRPEAVKATG